MSSSYQITEKEKLPNSFNETSTTLIAGSDKYYKREEGGMGENSQKVQTSGYNFKKLWGCNVQHGGYS